MDGIKMIEFFKNEMMCSGPIDPGYITLELVTSSLYCLKEATLSSTMSFFKGISLSFRITLNTKKKIFNY